MADQRPGQVAVVERRPIVGVMGSGTESHEDLAAPLGRAIAGHFKPEHHFGFEAAAWYWHFVDVVWLFLFTFVYWF